MITDPDAIAALNAARITDGVMSRRVLAWLIDCLLIGMIGTAVLSFCAFIGLITFGLDAFDISANAFGILPLVPLLYHWLTMASPLSASPGQAILGLTVRNDDDLAPVTPLQALIFTALLYVTLAVGVWPMLIALFTTRHRTFHDMLAGTVVVRKEALTRAAAFWNMGAAGGYRR